MLKLKGLLPRSQEKTSFKKNFFRRRNLTSFFPGSSLEPMKQRKMFLYSCLAGNSTSDDMKFKEIIARSEGVIY